jgi:hypothetical protein
MMMMFSFSNKEEGRIFFNWSGVSRLISISRFPASEEIHPINLMFMMICP